MPVLLNNHHERFAQLVATGVKAAEAYVRAGYSKKGAKQSASRLLAHADLQLRVAELKNAVAEQVVALAITDRNARLSALQERSNLLWQVIKERAADPCNQSAAGGKTGLLVRQRKMLGGGEFAVEIEEFAIDIAPLRELRDIERQAAIETGQWVEKRDLTGRIEMGELEERLTAARRRVPPRDSSNSS